MSTLGNENGHVSRVKFILLVVRTCITVHEKIFIKNTNTGGNTLVQPNVILLVLLQFDYHSKLKISCKIILVSYKKLGFFDENVYFLNASGLMTAQ